MNTNNGPQDPETIPPTQDADPGADTNDMEDENPELLVGDELSPEEEAALEEEGADPGIIDAPGNEDIPGDLDDTDMDMDIDMDMDKDTDDSGTQIAGDTDAEGTPDGFVGKKRIRWHLAPSLRRLFAAVNRRWPKRDKTSDGTIGDWRHTRSDHKPNSRGSVNACDIDKDRITPMVVVRAAIRHPSTNYVIYNKVIWSRAYKFRARKYKGDNPHQTHIHVSILQTRAAEQNKKRWGI